MTDRADETKSCWPGFWAGLLIALGTLLWAMFSPQANNMRAVEQGLARKVEAALLARGLADVKVEMNGQSAILTGVIADEAARLAAEQAALSAAGPGGVVSGGVTRVINRLEVGRAVSPYVWGAARLGDGVTLSGFAPDEAARQRIVKAAQRLFRGEVRNEMQIAAGAPSPEWGAVTERAVAELARLKRGSIRIVGHELFLTGEGDQPAVELVRAFYRAGLPAPFALGVDDLAIEGQGLGIPALEGQNLSDATSETCQIAFNLVMRNNEIRFESGSAAISPESRRLLDDLARVARRCDRHAIAIAGHTDDTGEAAANLVLSQARAEAVRNYLSGQGVAPERLSARGFGETQPKSPNTSAANRARNRRIVFTVG